MNTELYIQLKIQKEIRKQSFTLRELIFAEFILALGGYWIGIFRETNFLTQKVSEKFRVGYFQVGF